MDNSSVSSKQPLKPQGNSKDGVPGTNLFKNKAHMEEILQQARNYSLALHLSKIHQASEQGAKQAKQTPKGPEVQPILDQEANPTGIQPPQDIKSSNFFSTKPLDLLDLYLDAKDSVNNWCVAKIIDHDMANNRIMIHYDGWSQKFDETCRTTSSRIAPFRKHTQGYTGQQKVAMRDFDLNYSYQVMLLNRVQQVHKSNFQCFKDANECTQFIRGELYIYFDSLLSLVNQPSKTDAQKIFEFACEVFKMCAKWFDLMDQDLVEMMHLCHKHNTLFAVDLRAAIIMCQFELFDMIHKCVGLCERSSRFLRVNSKNVWYPLEYGDPAKADELGFIISLASNLAELGCFDKILGMFKFGAKEQDHRLPIHVLSSGIKTLVKLKEIGFKEKIAEDIFEKVRNCVQDFLKPENFSDSDIKDANFEELKWLIRVFSFFTEDFDKRNKIFELYELEISRRFLLSPYFEKRIRGMKEFKYVQEKIQNRHVRPQVDQNNRPIRLDITRFLDEQIFSKWVVDNKIIDFIFEENPHQELIKRSISILSIMAQDVETFPERVIDMIWSCCSPEKHEDIVRATFELITELSILLPLDRLALLYQKIQALTLNRIDDKTVQFMRDYSINAVQNIREVKRRAEQQKGKGSSISQVFSRRSDRSSKQVIVGTPSNNQQSKQQQQQSDFDRYVALQIFYEVARDENQFAAQKTKELAIQSMIDVLAIAHQIHPTIKEKYIQSSLESISKGQTVYLTINFLKNLLCTYPRDDQVGYSGTGYSRQKQRNQPENVTIETKIGQIVKSTDLIDAVIAQASDYMKYFKLENQRKALEQQLDSQGSAHSQSPAVGKILQQQENQKSSFVMNDKISHEDYINCFMGFIEFVITNCRSITLQFQHVQEMFKIFVTEAESELETRQFFDFLTKQNTNAKTRDRLHLLDERLKHQVFTRIMCNQESMNVEHLNNQAYDCFHTLFLGVNNQEGNLMLDQNDNSVMTQVNQYSLLQGLKTMWKIAIHCQQESVKEKCRNLLCDLHLLATTKNMRQKLQIQQDFVRQCRQNLFEAQQLQAKSNDGGQESSQIILNCIRLMRVYIQRFDKEHLIPILKQTLENMTPQEQKNTRVISIKLDPDEIQAEIEVNLNCKFWELMKICSQLFQIKMSEFFIFTKQGPLPNHMYNDFMRDYDIKEIQLQRLPQERLESELPSYVIGFDQDNIDVLLNALNHKDEIIANETIALLELLQINPKLKKQVSDSINKIKTIDLKAIEQVAQGPIQKEAGLANGADWQQIMRWEPNCNLSNTYYRLLCLRDLVTPKPSISSGVQMNNARIVRQQAVTQNSQALQQDRLAKVELQTQIVNKGGFHFLLFLLSNINKEVNFDQDILTSKTLQILITLLDKVHGRDVLQFLNKIEKPYHQVEMINSCLIITKNFLASIHKKQLKKMEELEEKIKQDPTKEKDWNEMRYNKMQFSPLQTVILTVALNFLSKILNIQPQNLHVMLKDDCLQQILKLGLIDIGHMKIQDKMFKFSSNLFQSNIEKKLTESMSQGQSEDKQGDSAFLSSTQVVMLPSHILLKYIIKDFLPMSLKEPITQKMKKLYELTTLLFSKTEVYRSLAKIEDPEKLVQNLMKMIKEREILEATSRDEDVVITGIFDFLGQILAKFPIVRQQKLPDKMGFVEFLIHHGLFNKEKRNQMVIQDQQKVKNLPPLCKHSGTRSSCLHLLRILCLDDLREKLFVTQYLQKNVCNETFWRTPRKVDWSIQVHQQERSLSGYVGLKNPGCICYMNSIMQNLFMIPAFRKLIIEVEDKKADEEPPEENVLHQVKCIFGGLMEVEKQYFNPKKFCRAFKDYDGSPIDLYVQKDVDEFFNMFMDRIEGLIKGTPQEKQMTNLFQGVFANEFICKDCPHYSEREEPFMAVILQVKNKNSVLDSLKFYVEGEMLEGDNAYYCEKCEKKVNTLKRQCLKRMPNILFLVLKRFEFDFDTMQKVKVNDYCEFPFELDMSPYSQQELARQDLIKTMEEKNRSIDDLNEEELHILKRKIPSNYYQYTLKGMVVHYGTSDQGHYYSFIQDREDKNAGWFEFNDTIVRDFDPSEIPEEAFGGDDANLQNNIVEMQQQKGGQVDQAMINAMRQFKTKIKNAYVLIYDRREVYDMAKVNEVMDDVKIGSLPPKDQLKKYQECLANQDQEVQPQIPPVVHDVILRKNKKFWLSKTIFSVDFIQKMHVMFKDIKLKEDNNYDKFMAPGFDLQASSTQDQFEAFKFLINFFMTVALRSKERTVLPTYLSLIREALHKNIGLCLWLLETFTNQFFIREFLLDCPIHDFARFTQGLLKTAMFQVYQKEKNQIAQYCKLLANPNSDPLGYLREVLKGYNIEESVVDGRQVPEDLSQQIFSGCSATNCFSISGHDKRVPKLICFINAFIHTSTSYYCLSRFKTTGQFWSIFSNFSLLGEHARQYLLETRCLGRLIDIFLNLQNDNFFTREALIQYQQKFRDLSLRKRVPLFFFKKNYSIGLDPERASVQLSSLERKLVFNFISPTATFLALAISNLTRSCQFVKPNGTPAPQAQGNVHATGIVFALDTLEHVPDTEEIELLHSYNNYKWWQYSHSKLTKNSICSMFAHISTDNKEFSINFIACLMNMIDNVESIHIRQFERPLLRMVQIRDRHQQERIKRILQKLTEIFKANALCYCVCDAIFEIVLKLCLRSPIFAQAFIQQQDLYRMIEKFSKDNQTLPVGGQSKMRVYKEGHIQWADLGKVKPAFLTRSKLDWIQRYNTTRIAKLNTHLKRQLKEQIQIATICASNDMIFIRLNQGENQLQSEFEQQQMAKPPQSANESVLSSQSGLSKKTSTTSTSANQQPQQIQQQIQEDLFDADDDMYGRVFNPGQQVDFSQNGRWYQGIVEIALEEMVKCVAAPNQDQNNNQTRLVHWIELESDALAPANSITNSDREHLATFYNELICYNSVNPNNPNH